MDLFNAFDQLNWLAVIFAALSSFAVGFVWYAKSVFGVRWMKLVGISEKQMNSSEGMTRSFVMTGIASLLTAITLGCLLITTNTEGFLNGLAFGIVIGFVFRAGAHVIHNGFARRSETLTLIDGLHDVVAIAIMGAILGAWM